MAFAKSQQQMILENLQLVSHVCESVLKVLAQKTMSSAMIEVLINWDTVGTGMPPRNTV